MNIFRSFVFSYYISVAGAWSAVPLCELGPAVVLLLSVCVAEEHEHRSGLPRFVTVCLFGLF